jgi:release factor glutamine methyltransferase
LKIQSCLVDGQNTLKESVDRPLLESEILLSYVLQKSREYLHTNDTKEVGELEREEFFSLLERRANGEPIEYLINRVSFYSNEFYIDKRALIPRPESEILLDKVVNLNLTDVKTILEVGVGSGVLSIMLKKLIKKDIEILATDISSDAIDVAKINAKKHAVNIEFIHTNLLDNIDKDIDLIISNPPYISQDYKIDKNLEFEPREALFAEDNGLGIIKKLIDIAIYRGVKYLVCEIGYDQKESIEEYLTNKDIKRVEFYKDLASFDRGFTLTL